ncbi:hypothetical protein RI367_006426 [Sorochytrium milnesiophthora]
MGDAATTACYVIDTVFAICIPVMQCSNIRQALQNFGKNALRRWQSLMYLATFSFGVLSGIITVAMSVSRLMSNTLPNIVAWNHANEFFSHFQLYLQAIIIVQRLHLVRVIPDSLGYANATLDVLVRRLPEIFWSVLAAVLYYIFFAYKDTPVAYAAATAWASIIFASDILISLITFNRIHSMLNTNQKAVEWYLSVLRSPDTPPEDVKDKKSYTSTRAIVWAWTLMMIALVLGVVIFVFCWTCLATSPAWYPGYRLAWVLITLWQRGGLMYIQAIKHVQSLRFGGSHGTSGSHARSTGHSALSGNQVAASASHGTMDVLSKSEQGSRAGL